MAKEDTQFKKGESGNPDGRPKGSISVISRIKKEFRENPERFDEFFDRYLKNIQNEKHIVEMIDGKPMQKTDVTSGGERIAFIPSELMDKNNINETNTSTEPNSEGQA